ncbi:MAG: efflux RND transporter permease subunit [Pirellulales bacterium]|nr:efflux RND transporter permease subunit [Pirellulales bacterium]
MFARFFIDRPVFAWVLSIVIVFAGLAAVVLLPIAQYPEITPPTVQVTCQYTGAGAEVLSDTVAAPIEQQVNGVERMMYMSSQCANDGTYNLLVTFELGTDLDMAQVLVQNRVNQALPMLPDAVKVTGVTVKKKSPSVLLVVNLFSEVDPQTNKPLHDQLYLSNYATIQVKDELARLSGVGDVVLFGQQDYSMRIWLDPEKMAVREVTAGDVVRVLKEQNVQVAAGQIGQPPVPSGQDFQYTITTLGRLAQPEEFADIILKAGRDGQITKLRDVGRIELGARNMDTRCRLDGRPSAGVAVYQSPGANALAVAEAVRAKMDELRQRFPQGLQYAIVYDTTPFINESVHEVFKTLRDAVILVAIVILLFLQDWKSLVLPLIDVGVSLVGTFAVMYVMGFTLNNLTLFGLVLAIGIVVDDAIVVLENIERWIGLGYEVREATIRAMDEITGPIIAITLVLCSVFLPSAMLGGITGQFYRQFALTIAASMVLSAINAMTMTPARATAVFKHRKPGAHEHDESREALPRGGIAILAGLLLCWLLDAQAAAWAGEGNGAWLWAIRAVLFLAGAAGGWFAAGKVNWLLGRLFRGFNRLFDWATEVYGKLVGRALRLSVIVLLLYGGLIGLTWLGLTRVPAGFIPNQDKGYLLANLQLPDSASLERTLEVTEAVERIVSKTPGVAHTLSLPGQSIVLNATSSNFGSMFIILEPFEHRHGEGLDATSIAARLRRQCYAEVLGAQVAFFGAPPVDGLGNAGGFKLMVEDRGDAGLSMLQGQADNLAEKGNRLPGLVGLMNSFRADTPQLYADIDRAQCKTLGVELDEVFDTLQVLLGGYYVNDFNRFGRTWQVRAQAEGECRASPAAVRQFMVRNVAGEMVPLGAVAEIRDSSGPVLITRYNMHPAAAINGGSLPGVSSGTVIAAMEALAGEELSRSMAFEWTELTCMEKLAAGTAVYAFVGAVILVYLVLAAQYESWSVPLAVILVVPMCVLCAVAGVALAGLDLNIFVQVGFVVLVGLASKNAILVVEFARDRQKEGRPAAEATIEAAKVRLRPIVMTSFAFILGVVPLVFAEGAGAEMRYTLGVAVFSGMLGVTLFGLFLTPVFYYVIQFVSQPAGAAHRPEAMVVADRTASVAESS